MWRCGGSHQNPVVLTEQGDRRKVLHWVITQFLVEDSVRGHWRIASIEQRVAVGCRGGHHPRTDDVVSTWPVVDNDRLSRHRLHLLRKHTRRSVCPLPRRERNHHLQKFA